MFSVQSVLPGLKAAFEPSLKLERALWTMPARDAALAALIAIRFDSNCGC
jgi:hypothetical protein